MVTTRRKRTTTTKRKVPARRKTAAKGTYWSGHVTKTSNALDLRAKVFASRDPHRIALSLKRSAESSKRRKGTPYQSAMSMLNFYINRAGKHLSASRKRILAAAKPELRRLYGK